jgi:hypothetical protein
MHISTSNNFEEFKDKISQILKSFGHIIEMESFHLLFIYLCVYLLLACFLVTQTASWLMIITFAWYLLKFAIYESQNTRKANYVCEIVRQRNAILLTGLSLSHEHLSWWSIKEVKWFCSLKIRTKKRSQFFDRYEVQQCISISCQLWYSFCTVDSSVLFIPTVKAKKKS